MTSRLVVTSSNLEFCGAFGYDPGSGTWSWAEETFAVYGFTPGDVVPTTELILFHQHPEDRAGFETFIAEVISPGRTGSLWHRVVDAAGVVRQVVTSTSTSVERDERTGRRRVVGHVVDVTEPARRATSREVEQAMTSLADSRPRIEQAKGALMWAYALDDEQAFAVLRRYSQVCNVKVRDVARDLVLQLGAGAGVPGHHRQLLDRLVDTVRPDLMEPGA
jgi:hypothetical protein